MKAKKKTDLADSAKDKKHLKPEEFDINEDIVSLDTNVTKEEKKALSDAAKKSNTRDQQNLDAAALDEYDEEGELLNQKGGLGGEDLDVPGSELDDDDEAIGEEDEENNPYSVDEENEDNDINTRQ